jgi:hypothetical protein
MSDVFFEEPVREKLVAPAKRWRNKWFNDGARLCCDGRREPDGEFWSWRIFASKDLAETWAAEWLSVEGKRAINANDRWLGAFPIDGDAQ